MHKYKSSKKVPYKISDIYNMVLDISKYSEFLPYCVESSCKKSGSKTYGKITIGHQIYNKSFTSIIKTKKNEFIEMTPHKNTFNKFYAKWEFKPLSKHETEIKFEIDFKLHSMYQNMIMEIIFKKICESINDAFLNRAKTLFE